MVIAFVPMLLHRERSNGYGTGKHLQSVRLGERLADMTRQRRNQIGGQNDGRKPKKSGNSSSTRRLTLCLVKAPSSNAYPVPETMLTCASA